MTDAERKDQTIRLKVAEWVCRIVRRIRKAGEMIGAGRSAGFLKRFVSPDIMVNKGPGPYEWEFDFALEDWEDAPNHKTASAVVAVRQQIDDYWQDAAKE